jgi:hypothetical protein
VPSKTEWSDLVEAAYSEISPRDDPDGIAVQSVEPVDDVTCIADVNPPGVWVESTEIVEVDGEPLELENMGTVGIGEQKVRVSLLD